MAMADKSGGSLPLDENLGVKNMPGSKHADLGQGKAGGKVVSTPIGTEKATPNFKKT
jgi:hypothetical protein